MSTMTCMRYLIAALLLTACCTEPRPDSAANLCPTGRDRTDECMARCAAGPGTESCVPGWEAVCFKECRLCNPVESWCPLDAWCQH